MKAAVVRTNLDVLSMNGNKVIVFFFDEVAFDF